MCVQTLREKLLDMSLRPSSSLLQMIFISHSPLSERQIYTKHIISREKCKKQQQVMDIEEQEKKKKFSWLNVKFFISKASSKRDGKRARLILQYLPH